ncbi:MAG: hypothetical protein Q9202_007054 [Teloschistes flavicans]
MTTSGSGSNQPLASPGNSTSGLGLKQSLQERSSQKRPAQVPLLAFGEATTLLKERAKRAKLAIAEAAEKAAHGAEKMDLDEPQKPADATEVDNKFSYKEIPFKATWHPCCLAFHGDTHDEHHGQFFRPSFWTELAVKIDAGRVGYPKISLRFRADKNDDGAAITDKTDCDVFECSWYAATREPLANELQVQSYHAEPFNDWYGNNPNEHDRPFLRGEGLGGVRDMSWTVDCLLQGLIIDRDFEIQEQWTLCHAFKHRLDAFKTEAQGIRLWFKVLRGTNAVKHMTAFDHRVRNNLGILSQYYDPVKGESLLRDPITAPTIDAVGDGMFCKTKNAAEFWKLPRIDSFMSAKELGTYTAISAVRDAQHMHGRHAWLEGVPLECFVKSVPRFGGKEIQNMPRRNEQKYLDTAILVYIRCNSGDEKALVPKAKLRVELEWDTATASRRHVRNNKKNVHGTTIATPKFELEATGTDFCVLVPFERWQQRPLEIHHSLQYKEFLPRVYVHVFYNESPNQREVDASHAFVTSDHPPLVNFRNMLLNPTAATSAQQDVTDIRQGFRKTMENVQRFDNAVAAAGKGTLNEDQMNFIKQLGNIRGNVLCLAGPPGTGKTFTLSCAIRGIVATGQKSLVVGPSNTSVDNISNGVRNAGPADDKMKNLWLGISSAEKDALLREIHAEIDLTKPLPSWASMNFDNDPRVQVVLSEFLAEERDSRETFEFDQAFERHKDIYGALQSTSRTSIKAPKVPFKDTMGGHISRIIKRDEAEAAASGLPNPSAEYAKVHRDWVQEQDQVGSEMKKRFLLLREQMEDRVFAEIDCLFTTMNNSGSQDFEAHGFKPSIIIMDEVGQATLSTTMIPVSKFRSYEAVILAGDWRQLEPTVQAKQSNEASEYANISTLQRLEMNGAPTAYLIIQYRMAASITRFPAAHIYQGRLTTHPSAMVDNTNRQIVRKVAREQYAIKSETEYFFINVPYGQGREEVDGRSVFNYANVDAVEKLLNRLLAEGIAPEAIVILTLYKAQARLLAAKISRDSVGRLKYREISTVDAFQGNEAPVIVFDTVLTRESALQGKKFSQNLNADFNEDSSYGKVNNISMYGRNPHRLNVAGTRGRDGYIVVGQMELITRHFRKALSKLANTLYYMGSDLWEKKLVGFEPDLFDSYPEADNQRLKAEYEAKTQEEKAKEHRQRNIRLTKEFRK